MTNRRGVWIIAVPLGVVLVAVLVSVWLGGRTPPSTPLATLPPGSTASSPIADWTPGPSESFVLPTAPPTPAGPPRVRALADREVFGFMPYSELGQSTTVVDFKQVTTIAYSAIEAGADGNFVVTTANGSVPAGYTNWKSPGMDDLIAKAHAAHVRVVLTIDRFAWGPGQARTTTQLLQSSGARATLISQVVTEVAARGVDGVNLDFEPIPAQLSDDFTALVQDMRAALDASRPGLQLTVDVSATMAGYDLPALTADNAADAAIIMGYEYLTANAEASGSTDPLDSATGLSLRSSVDTATQLADPAHLILALPWYGRAWSTATGDPHSQVLSGDNFGNPGTVTYSRAVGLAQVSGREWDATEASAWTAFPSQPCKTCPVTWRQVWYDDVDSVRAKVGLAVDNGLRGVGIWALGFDGLQPELWSALHVALGTTKDTTPPKGKVTADSRGIRGQRSGLPVVVATGGLVKLQFTVADGSTGSGVAFVRLSDSGAKSSGQLVKGDVFPASDGLDWTVSDPAFGGSKATGVRTIWVQWRDVAGNWSTPVTVRVWVKSMTPPPPPPPAPTPTPTPSPSPSPSPAPSGSPAPAESPSPSPSAAPNP